MSNFGYDEIRMLGSVRPPLYDALSSSDIPSADDQKIAGTFAAKPRLLSRRGALPSKPSVLRASEEIRTLQSAGKKLDVCTKQPIKKQPTRNETTLPVLCGTVKPLDSPRNSSRNSLLCTPVQEDISKVFSLAKVSGSTSKFPLGRSNSHSANNCNLLIPRKKPVLTRSATCPSNLESKFDDRSGWVSFPLTSSHTKIEERGQTASAGSLVTLPQMKCTERLVTTGKREEDLVAETLKVFNSSDVERAENLELNHLSHTKVTAALPLRLRRFNRASPHEISGCMKALTLNGTAFPIHRKIMGEECRIHAEAINMHVEKANDDYNVIETKAGIIYEWLKGQK